MFETSSRYTAAVKMAQGTTRGINTISLCAEVAFIYIICFSSFYYGWLYTQCIPQQEIGDNSVTGLLWRYHIWRTLTPSEKNYAQIEKEGLAFGLKKFHQYGRKFTSHRS